MIDKEQLNDGGGDEWLLDEYLAEQMTNYIIKYLEEQNELYSRPSRSNAA